MNNTVIVSTLSMAGLGLFFALVLALVNQKLKVKENPKLEEIEHNLVGTNCGACGFASCRQYAEVLARGEASPSLCKALDEESAKRLSGILGVEIEKKTKEIAILHCGADASKRKKKATYLGIETCIAAHNTSGGEILCDYGCLGYGDCMKVCPFGAITMINKLPKVNKDRCTACGKCILACPRKLFSIEEITKDLFIYVACNNQDKGVDMQKTCSVGCIACGICQRLTGGVFYLENNLACMQYGKLKGVDNKEEVINKCPTKCIVKLNNVS